MGEVKFQEDVGGVYYSNVLVDIVFDSKMFLSWAFESKNGTRYDAIVQYIDCDDDSGCYTLDSTLHAIDKNGESREYDFDSNQWKVVSDEELKKM